MTNLEERLAKIDKFINSFVDYDEVLNALQNIETLMNSDKEFYDVDVSTNLQTTIECFIYKYPNPYTKHCVDNNNISLSDKNTFSLSVPSIQFDDLCRSKLVLSNKNHVERPFSYDTSTEEMEQYLFEMKVQYGDMYSEDLFLFLYVLYKKYMKHVPFGYDISFDVYSKEPTGQKTLEDVLLELR